MVIIGDNKRKQYRNELRDCLIFSLDFSTGLFQAKKYLRYFKKNRSYKSDFRFLYYIMAIFYRKLNMPFHAITNLKKSKKYTDDDAYEMDNLFIQAQILQDLKINDKALKLYKKCYNYYYELGLKEYYSRLMCNIGEITHDELLIRRGIKIYNDLENEDLNSKRIVLQEMKKILEEAITYHENKN